MIDHFPPPSIVINLFVFVSKQGFKLLLNTMLLQGLATRFKSTLLLFSLLIEVCEKSFRKEVPCLVLTTLKSRGLLKIE